MKKIGVLTFHDSLSYGATLQCYALQETIRKLGFKTEFINFIRTNNAAVFDSKQSFKKNICRKLVLLITSARRIAFYRNYKNIRQLFCEFKRNFLSINEREFNTLSSLCSYHFDYDAYVAGSDQIWNPNSNFLEIYGLSFVSNDKNTIAYAPSMGVGIIPDDKKERMYNAVHCIRHISCREKEGASSLSKLLNRNVCTVLDPTLLLEDNEWNSMVSVSKKEKYGRYILCFFLGSLDYARDIARKMAKENNCKLVIIPRSPKDVFFRGKLAYNCGPIEFIDLIHNSCFVCTDSFHGTCFSIIFNKPFYVFCRRGFEKDSSNITRIKNLVELCGLTNRLVFPEDNVDLKINKIDYDKVNTIIKEEREKSIYFLKSSLLDEF